MARRCTVDIICTTPGSDGCVGVSDDECRACKVSALLSALEELGGGWRPIKEAKVGRRYLLVWSGVVQNHAYFKDEDGWYAEPEDEKPCENFYPTLCMPLPPAPKE